MASFCSRLISTTLALIGLVLSVPAHAQSLLAIYSGDIGPHTLLTAVGETTGHGSVEFEAIGPGIGDLMLVDLMDLVEKDPRFQGCDIAFLEWRRRADVLKEIELQNSGLVDQNSVAARDIPPEPTSLIEGSVTLDGSMVTWSFAMTDRATGTKLATSTGTLPDDQIWDISRKVAADMLTSACPKKEPKKLAFAVKAKIDDLLISTVVCDASGPFQIVSEENGAQATISFVPASPTTGSYTYAGHVAAAEASGNGTYVLDLREDGNGTLTITGVFMVKAPFGMGMQNGTVPMQLSPPGPACG